MDTNAPQTLGLTIEVTWRPLQIPPRCRTPRPVPNTREVTVSVPVYTDAQAPVVVRLPNDTHTYRYATELRHDGQHFYEPETDYQGRMTPLAEFPTTLRHDSWSEDFTTAQRDAVRDLEDIAIIDGHVWHRTSEPVYTVYTLGLGSGLEVVSLDLARNRTAPHCIFPAVDPQAAIDGATAIARDRGDEHSVRGIENTPLMEVLDPSVFKVPSAAQRAEQARKQIAGLLDDVARSVTTGHVTRNGLDKVQAMIKQASDAMYSHGIELLER